MADAPVATAPMIEGTPASQSPSPVENVPVLSTKGSKVLTEHFKIDPNDPNGLPPIDTVDASFEEFALGVPPDAELTDNIIVTEVLSSDHPTASEIVTVNDDVVKGSFTEPESSNPDRAVAMPSPLANEETTIKADEKNIENEVLQAKVLHALEKEPLYQKAKGFIMTEEQVNDPVDIARKAFKLYELLKQNAPANQSPESTQTPSINFEPSKTDIQEKIEAYQAKMRAESLVTQQLGPSLDAPDQLTQILNPADIPTVVPEPATSEVPQKTSTELVQEAQLKITQAPEKFPEAKKLKEAIKEDKNLFERLLKKKLYAKLYNQDTGERVPDMNLTEADIQEIANATLAEYNVIKQSEAVAETQQLAEDIEDALQQEQKIRDEHLTPDEKQNLNNISEKIIEYIKAEGPEEMKKKKLALWKILIALGFVSFGGGIDIVRVGK